MSAENVANDQQPIKPEAPELEDGELSEAELDAQSGGSGQNPSLSDLLGIASSDPYDGIRKNEDSGQNAIDGIPGTDRNRVGNNIKHIPLNLPMTFP